jgi:hypothetical protein
VPESRLDRVLGRLAGRRAAAPAHPLHEIVERLNALEAMVEGLQDSVDRQARRQDERLTALSRRLEPGELARALSEDARKRGL